MNHAFVLNQNCSGPNPRCRAAYAAGRPVHVMPRQVDPATHASLVMPTYHYATVAEGVASVNAAYASAPIVLTDDDLDRYRAARVPHFLQVGWVDPTMRRATCPGTPHRGHTVSIAPCPWWRLWCSKCEEGGHTADTCPFYA
jgi:hypothetical protein